MDECIPYKIEVYTIDGCSYCEKVKKYFNDRNIPFTEIKIRDPETLEKVEKLVGEPVVPVIVIDDEIIIRGFDKSKLPTNPCKNKE